MSGARGIDAGARGAAAKPEQAELTLKVKRGGDGKVRDVAEEISR